MTETMEKKKTRLFNNGEKFEIDIEQLFDNSPWKDMLEASQSLLCNAFEGGSNYWYMIEDQHQPDNFDNVDDDWREFNHIAYPTCEGGYLMISDEQEAGEEDKRTEKLDLDSIRKGWRIMLEKYPHHFFDALQQNDDAITGDVFLQCCLYEELIYG